MTTLGLIENQLASLGLHTMAEKVPHGVAGAPNETALLALMERTGYSMIQENGQRKYGGPPPGWNPDTPAPARGCEVFVGKIPRDLYEDELVPVFEKVGSIYELRLMMDFSGSNRGYCFVMFTTRDEAKRAVHELNNFEIRKGRFLGVCLSVDNCRLFVGGIPKNKQRDEIFTEMKKVTEGVVDVIVYPSATDKAKNRGFAFVEYESHRAAAMARRKLIPGRIQLWGHQIAVDWAEPEQDVDEDIMAKVKILYVRNLMLNTTEENLERIFNEACNKEGAVERVKKLRDYAFVHFKEREDALQAMRLLNGNTIDNSVVEVTLAKPVDKNNYVRYTRGGGRGGIAQVATPLAGFPGLDPNTFGQAALYSAQYAPAALAAASGFAANPSLNMRGSVRGRGRGAAGSRGAGGVGRGYLPSYLRTGYRKVGAQEDRLYDILPSMELTPVNPVSLNPASKNPIQLLEEICSKNAWGSPVYQLHSAVNREGAGDMQLFLFKVSIPALTNQYPNSTFTPNKLCRTVEEAKNYAAEYVLLQLGMSIESGESVLPSSGVVSPASSTTPTLLSNTAAYQGRPIIPATVAQTPYNGLAALQGLAGLQTPALATADPLTSPAAAAAAAAAVSAYTTPIVVSSMSSASYPSALSPTLGKLPSATPPQSYPTFQQTMQYY